LGPDTIYHRLQDPKFGSVSNSDATKDWSWLTVYYFRGLSWLKEIVIVFHIYILFKIWIIYCKLVCIYDNIFVISSYD
jgi:hypothetical protein